jgi:methionyl-tRNA synthetase
VPFRLTGNIEWGVKVPDKDGLNDLTFWVWPESLWAPISFTRTYLEQLHKQETEWKQWWCSEDAKVYQFIGEDNIYFYGIAEMAMFMALNSEKPDILPKDGELMLPHLIANNHVLFMDKKASSSSEIKPPMAKELLNYYTPEQLRMHFLSLGLDTKSVSFMPQVYMQNREGQDTVLKEGNLLTNVYNRMIRSCFYTAQKYYESRLPKVSISEEIRNESIKAILTYERHMYNHEFHRVTEVLDTYIRNMNKYWVNNIRVAEMNEDSILRSQVLIDTFHAVRTVVSLLHPIAPTGCEMIREYLGVGDELWSWDHIFDTLEDMMLNNETHRLKFLEPRVDFFQKHETQFVSD